MLERMAGGNKSSPLSLKPELTDLSYYYYSIFMTLNSSRDYGAMGGVFPIKISEIEAFCRLFKIDSLTDRTDLFKIITFCDRIYIDLLNKKLDNDRSK